MEIASRRGRRRPLTVGQQGLAADYLPLARRLARPLKRSWPHHRDEFESAAALALVEAAEAFDPTRNVKFATFARHRICGALLDVQRKLSRRVGAARRRGGNVKPLGPGSEVRGTVLGIVAPDQVGAEIEALDEFEAMLRKLPRRHAAAVRQLHLHHRTQCEAAAILGISQSRLSVMHREAIAMLDGSWYDRDRPAA